MKILISGHHPEIEQALRESIDNVLIVGLNAPSVRDLFGQITEVLCLTAPTPPRAMFEAAPHIYKGTKRLEPHRAICSPRNYHTHRR